MLFSLFFLGKHEPELISNGPYAPYSAAHIIIILAAFFTVALLVRMVCRKSARTRLVTAAAVYGILVLLNIMRMIWEVSAGEFDIRTSLPLELCGLQMFALPFALFSHGRFGILMRDFAFSYGTLGFVMSLLMPFTTLYDYPLWHFRTVQSILYHTALGFVCLSLPALGYEPHVKNARKAFAVLVAAAMMTGAVNLLTGSNYMNTATLPLPAQIVPWPYYLPLLLGFAFAVGRLPYYAFHLLHNRRQNKTTDATLHT